MDNDHLSGGQSSGITYYVSVSREHNGRIKLSASAHYNAPADEDAELSAFKLTQAVATSLTVGAMANAAIETIINSVGPFDPAVQDFIQLVTESAGGFAQRLGSTA